MPTSQPLVKLTDVDVDIDGQPILRQINIEIARGHHWGIVGANGSGKSTLMALIAGNRWPAPGRGLRTYDFGSGPERDAVSARELVALIGHELQDLYTARGWNFRVCDIVHSGLTRTDIPRRNPSRASLSRVERLLERMGLSHLAERRILELSRGEQRRVLITRGLAFEPRLLLLDEPASGLDSKSRTELEATLALAAEKSPIVTTAHRVEELPEIVTDIAVIDNGRLDFWAESCGESIPVATARQPFVAKRSSSRLEAREDNRDQGTGDAGDAGDARDAGDAGDAGDAASSVLISLDSASAWLGGRQILKELDWELESGDNWLIRGENGAGKSTFLRLLHAQIRPARGGRIAWPGLGDPKDVWELRRQVALVSPELQARYRFPTRVFDAIASGFHSSIGLVHRLSSEERDRVETLIDGFELEKFRDRPLSTLSYGQRHRALIARTLATNPRLLLLDEPWEGLDEKTSKIVGAALAGQMARGTQVVCVSHVGTRELSLNRTLEIWDGRIVSADGNAARPENSASAR